MSRKFQSKSGLPEAIGSTAHQPSTERPYKPREMCDIPGCRSRRTRLEKLPDGNEQWLYAQGYGEIVIRTEGGKVHGHVCQVCYMRILEQSGEDQLSCAARTEERIAQTDMPLRADKPRGLVDHLMKIQDQLQHAQDRENASRWQHDLEEFEQHKARDDALAARYADDADEEWL